MRLVRTGDPAVELVTTAEAKAHLRVLHADDDTYIDTLVVLARKKLEKEADRAFVTQTWEMHLDRFPDEPEIEFPRAPLQSVTSVGYTDTNGDAQTFSAESYIVDTSGECGRIGLAEGESWPATQPVIDVVTITFVAGYGDAASDVPEHVKHWVLLYVAHLYENREPVVTGTIVTPIPDTLAALFEHERVVRF